MYIYILAENLDVLDIFKDVQLAVWVLTETLPRNQRAQVLGSGPDQNKRGKPGQFLCVIKLSLLWIDDDNIMRIQFVIMFIKIQATTQESNINIIMSDI